jgi:poly-gamma-glutamate synthesis protein (capsule biosynthesis protein)
MPFSLRAFFILCIGSLALGSGCATLPQETVHESTPERSSITPSPTPEPTPTLPEWSIVAGGDVTPADGLDPLIQQFGPDYPYRQLAPIFSEADLGLVNLESPISSRGKALRGKRFTFRAHPSAAPALKRAGINVVAMANNHILDYGPQALEDTLKHLDQAGVAHAGAGKNIFESRKPALIVTNSGTTVAVLSYSMTYPEKYWASSRRPGTTAGSEERIQEDVTSACARSAAVVVCFHWGGELLTEPRDYQIKLGHAAIDAGAKLVVGTHPHILQGLEWYKNGLILYSLGNLAFGGGSSRRAVQSALVKVSFTNKGNIHRARVRALSVDNQATRFQPTVVEGFPAAAIYLNLKQLSSAWNTEIVPATDGWAEIIPPSSAKINY